MAQIHVPGATPEESGGTAPSRRRLVRWLVGGAAVALIAASVTVVGGIASADVTPAHVPASSSQPDFGPT